MSWSVNSSGTLSATVGTPSTLATITSAGVYQLWVDLSNMVLGDLFQVWGTYKIDGSNARRFWSGFYQHAQVNTAILTPPVPVNANALAFVVEQFAGTSRNFPWQILSQATPWIVDGSGSTTPTVGTPSTLYTESTSGTIAAWVDTANMVNGDLTSFYSTYQVDGSNARQFDKGTFQHAQQNPGKLWIPTPIYNSKAFLINQTAGTARAYPYQILRV